MNIGQASEASGVSQRMIRHYEKIGLIPAPPRRGSGYRDYSDADLHRLRFIANARDLGSPIEDIRQLLDLWNDGERSSAEVKALAMARPTSFNAGLPRSRQCAARWSSWPSAAMATTGPIVDYRQPCWR